MCLRTLCITVLLSTTIYQNLHRCRLHHDFARVVRGRSAEAYPQSSLPVDDDVSLAPSTGPEHGKRVLVLLAMVQPNDLVTSQQDWCSCSHGKQMTRQ